MKSFYVYELVNRVNRKRYVGKTSNLQRRWQQHQNLAINKNSPYPIHSAIRKYGVSAFNIKAIAVFVSEEDAYEYERQYIKEHKLQENANGYNLADGGRGFSREDSIRYNTSRAIDREPRISETIRGLVCDTDVDRLVPLSNPKLAARRLKPKDAARLIVVAGRNRLRGVVGI